MCISTSCRPFNHTPTPLCRPVITDALSDPSPTTFLFAIDHMSRTYTNISKTHSSVLSWIMLFPRKMVSRTQLFPTHAFSIFFFFWSRVQFKVSSMIIHTKSLFSTFSFISFVVTPRRHNSICDTAMVSVDLFSLQGLHPIHFLKFKKRSKIICRDIVFHHTENSP